MRTIDRYLLSQFARVLLMTLVSLLGIYVVADFVTNYAEFMEVREASENFGSQLLNYYLARAPWFFNVAGRMIVLLSVVFVISTLQRQNEMTAMMAAGISQWRIVSPLVAAAAAMAVLGVANREIAIPAYKTAFLTDVKDLTQAREQPVLARYDNDTDILFDGESLVSSQQRLIQPRLRLPVNWSGVGRSLRAAEAMFRLATPDVPSGYLLQDLVGVDSSNVKSYELDGQPVVWTAMDHDWLEGNQCFVVSRLKPEYLSEDARSDHHSSTRHLLAGLRDGSLAYAPSVRVTVHARLVQPLLDMTLVFLGLPAALLTQRRHVFTAAAKSVLMITMFSIVVLVSHGLGIQGVISPSLSAWAPVMVLVPVAILVSGPLHR